ncbi:MAG: tetratricopeptide repeat protein [Planctomycetota bacterium]|jgi:tetratricopeptide (TPR) repeat protein
MFRSNRVGYAYYVGGLMLQLLREKYGEEGIVKALQLWAKDAPQSKVFKEAFGLGLEEFDNLFEKEIEKRVGGYRIVPDYSLIYNRLLSERDKNPKDGLVDVKLGFAHLRRGELVDAGSYLDQARRKGAGDKPLAILLDAFLKWNSNRRAAVRGLLENYIAKGGESFQARMMLAQIVARAGEAEADKVIEHLKMAKKDWPLRAAGANPYSLLYREYMRREMPKEALKELEEQSAILATSVPIRLRLAREYRRENRVDDGIRVLEEALRISNFERNVHDALLPLYRERKDAKKAIRSGRCRVALRTEEDADEDVAGMWLDLADVYLDAGQVKEARAAFDEAKKLADAETLPRIAEVERRLGA